MKKLLTFLLALCVCLNGACALSEGGEEPEARQAMEEQASVNSSEERASEEEKDDREAEPTNDSEDEAEAVDSVVLLTAGAGHLHAEADGEDGAAGVEEGADRRVEAVREEAFHGAFGGADAGEDERVGAQGLGGVARDDGAGVEPFEREPDARQVSGAVV